MRILDSWSVDLGCLPRLVVGKRTSKALRQFPLEVESDIGVYRSGILVDGILHHVIVVLKIPVIHNLFDWNHGWRFVCSFKSESGHGYRAHYGGNA